MTKQIEQLPDCPTDGVTPYALNSKEHNSAQIKHIAESIRQFGFTQPIVCDEEFIILAGHGRWQAAKLLGLEHVPVWKISGLSDDEKRAYRIVDNKLNADTGFNIENLQAEVALLIGAGFDLASLNLQFNLDELIEKTDRGDADTDTTKDKLKTYENNNVKQIVLYFEGDAYEATLTKLNKVMEQNSLENNTDAFMLALNEFLGE